MRAALRVLGLILLAGAAAIALARGTGEPLGAALFALDRALLNTTQAVVQRYLSPGLWDGVFLPALEWPAWVLPAALGVVLLALSLLLGRHGVTRRRVIP